MENLTIEKYENSPLMVGKVDFKEEFFHHSSIAIFCDDVPIMLLGLQTDKLALQRGYSLINNQSFKNLISNTLNIKGKLPVDVSINRVVSQQAICIKRKFDKSLQIIFSINNEELSKSLATHICLDDALSKLVSE